MIKKFRPAMSDLSESLEKEINIKYGMDIVKHFKKQKDEITNAIELNRFKCYKLIDDFRKGGYTPTFGIYAKLKNSDREILLGFTNERVFFN